MTILSDFRKNHPEYDQVSDAELADALYQKHYAGQMDRNAFNAHLGLSSPAAQDSEPGMFQKLGQIAAGLIGGTSRGLTLGADQHIEAGITSLIPWDRLAALDGKTDVNFMDYKGNLDAIRARNARQKAGAPNTHAIGEFGGGFIGLGKLADLGITMGRYVPGGVKGVQRLGANMAAMAGDGALAAGTMATMDGNNIVGSAATGAQLGAGMVPVKSVAQRGLQVAGPWLKARQPDILKTFRTDHKKLDKFIKDIGSAVGAKQAEGVLHDIFRTIPLQGQDQTTSQQTPNIGEFINVTTSAHGWPGAKNFMDSVRSARNRHDTAKELNSALEHARRTAQNKTFGNVLAQQRAAVKDILNSENKNRSLDASTREAMERFSTGSVPERFARQASTFGLNSDNTFRQIAGSTVGGILAGPAGIAAVPALATLSGKSADVMSAQNLKNLQHTVRTGKPLPGPLEALSDNMKQAIFRAMITAQQERQFQHVGPR